ncbi:MAG: hypothetical protein AAB922_01195 [Patescibacteria group bacterium]
MASTNTLIIWRAQDGRPPSANGATFDLRNVHPVLDFDDATDESVDFEGVLPRNYAGGGVTVYIHYCDEAIAGVLLWQAAFERIGDGSQDIDADGFAATQSSASLTVPATSGNVDIASIAFTDGAQIDSIAVGEAFRLRINRDANNILDTLVGDANLLFVELQET